jgi:hypothetical protein
LLWILVNEQLQRGASVLGRECRYQELDALQKKDVHDHDGGKCAC